MNIEPEHHAKNFSSHAVCMVSTIISPKQSHCQNGLKLYRKQLGMAQRSSTGLFPFQRPRSPGRFTPWSTRSTEPSVPTLDTAGLVTVVRTVTHLVTLLCSMDTGPITTLEFIWLAGHQSFKTTHSSISHTELSHLCGTF